MPDISDFTRRILAADQRMPGGLALERLLHRRFAAHRLHGEWFGPEAAEGIDALLAVLDQRFWP